LFKLFLLIYKLLHIDEIVITRGVVLEVVRYHLVGAEVLVKEDHVGLDIAVLETLLDLIGGTHYGQAVQHLLVICVPGLPEAAFCRLPVFLN
jgi:hypothetical protein